jgi:proteasome lid subunit RPN8/RPN11
MLFIERLVLRGMIAEVEPSVEECCGFFFGHVESKSRTITKSMVVNNSKEGDKRTNFEITSKDYLHAERFAEQENLALLGVYHSHPNHPAVPSEYDRAAAQPYFSYIIISVMNKKFAGIRSWQLDNNFQFIEEKIGFIQSSA